MKWNTDMEEAFEILKRSICEDVCLAFPDYGEGAEPLELYVDASGIGAGACLAQKQDGDVRIIAYASTTFSEAQRHYSTIERELAALRWGVKALRPFIIGSPFILHTDHQPLIYLNNMKIIDSRLARTLEDLADFNFTIQYTPGKDNSAADALSRLYDSSCVHQSSEVTFEPDKLPPGLMIIEKVLGGGDCLFESLNILASRVALAKPSCESALALRQLLIDELMRRHEQYHIVMNRDQRKQLRLMRSAGQLPCAEVLYAFGYLFQCVVLVHYGSDQVVTFIPPMCQDGADKPRVHLQCLSGIHYNPVTELKEYNYCATPLHSIVDNPNRSDVCDASIDEFGQVEELGSLGAVETPFVEELTWCFAHRRCHSASLMLSFKESQYCALFDTGAQVSCITRQLIIDNQLIIQEDPKYVVVGLGSRQTVSLGVIDLLLEIPGVCCFVHQYIVVPDSALPCCILFGADFMMSHNLILDCSRLNYQQGDRVGFFKTDPAIVDAAQGSVALYASRLSLEVQEICVGSNSYGLHFEVEPLDGGLALSALLAWEEVQQLQRRSTMLTLLRKTLNSGNSGKWPQLISQFKKHHSNLRVEDDIVVYHSSKSVVPVITFKVLVELMLVVHYNMSHIGRQKLLEMVRQQVWHPSLGKVAGDITSSCDECQKVKISSMVVPPTFKVQTTAPFEMVVVDVVNLPRSAGYSACLVAADHHGKWLSVMPLSSKTSASVALAFETGVLPKMLRCPEKVLSDNGPEFVGSPFNDLLSSYGITHIYTTPNHPPSNGLAERTIRTLTELLRVDSGSREKWTSWLTRAVMIYNTTYHVALEKSPAEFLLQQSHAMVSSPILSTEERAKWREGNPSFGTFKVGQKVLKRNVITGNDTTNKFKERFSGPYAVTKVNSNGVTYQVQNCGTQVEIRAHHGQLKRYVEPPKYLRDHPYYKSLQEDSKEQEAYADQIPAGTAVELLLSTSTDSPESSFHGFSDNSGEVESVMEGASSGSGNADESYLTGAEQDAADSVEGSIRRMVCESLEAEERNPFLMTFPNYLNKGYYSLNCTYGSSDKIGQTLDNAGFESHLGLPSEFVEDLWEFSSGEDQPSFEGFSTRLLQVDAPAVKSIVARGPGTELALNLYISSDKLSVSGVVSTPRVEETFGGSLLQMLEDMVTNLNHQAKLCRPVIQSPPALKQGEETDWAAAVTSSVRSPIRTRSSGAVPILPNVQRPPIEYTEVRFCY